MLPHGMPWLRFFGRSRSEGEAKGGVVFLKCLVLLATLCSTASVALDLRVAPQDSAPKFVKQGEVWRGICVDIMRAIEYVDPEVRFLPLDEFMTLPRIEAALESGGVDVGCALARTPQRVERFHIVDVPLYHAFARLAVRANDPVELRSFSDLRHMGGKVLSVRGTIHSQILLARGMPVDQSSERVADSLRRLVEGKGRFVFHNDFALRDSLSRTQLDERVRVLPNLFDFPEMDSARYMMVSRRAAPEVREHLRVALETLQRSGELARIFESFKLR